MLIEEEIEKIAHAAAQEIMDRIEMPELLSHIIEHEVLGHGTIINRERAENPDIPCKVFEYAGDTFAWKPGILGLISSQKNPEQIALCKIRVPASPKVAERFKKIKGALGSAVKEAGSQEAAWQAIGERLQMGGVEI